MQAIVLIGIPGSGKSTYCREVLWETHLRLSRDQLKTRRRLAGLLAAAIDTQTPFAHDATNVTRAEREPTIAAAKRAGYEVVGLFFESKIEPCLARNAARAGRARVPDAGVRGRRNELELPTLAEGFDALRFVRIEGGRFVESPWRAEPGERGAAGGVGRGP
ncbi:AAA family ATPase [Alienimonas californiensis]|uniref:Zeta toxin n=1 Tax=Alienimonas californiensis TaxID=2527989 RepID=A0A517P6J8_9PLAN|nr:AAA family ATPase [Alienimonas californiensis]QDT14983.1 hypothetical protein CA12_10630 [Alienimonas californiensis]